MSHEPVRDKLCRVNEEIKDDWRTNRLTPMSGQYKISVTVPRPVPEHIEV